MTPSRPPLVSAAELEALVGRWGDRGQASVDRYYPLRMAGLCLLALVYVVMLLVFPQKLADMTQHDMALPRMTLFFYVRGWGLLLGLLVGVMAYWRNWYPGLVFGSFSIMTSVMLMVDLIIVYPPLLSEPTLTFTLLLALRILAIGALILNTLNCLRLPPREQRLDLLLFRHRARVTA